MLGYIVWIYAIRWTVRSKKGLDKNWKQSHTDWEGWMLDNPSTHIALQSTFTILHNPSQWGSKFPHNFSHSLAAIYIPTLSFTVCLYSPSHSFTNFHISTQFYTIPCISSQSFASLHCLSQSASTILTFLHSLSSQSFTILYISTQSFTILHIPPQSHRHSFHNPPQSSNSE